jgi:hypothetical protein
MLVDLHDWDLAQVWQFIIEFLLRHSSSGWRGVELADDVIRVFQWLLRLSGLLFHLYLLRRRIDLQLALRFLFVLVVYLLVLLLPCATAEETEAARAVLLLLLFFIFRLRSVLHPHLKSINHTAHVKKGIILWRWAIFPCRRRSSSSLRCLPAGCGGLPCRSGLRLGSRSIPVDRTLSSPSMAHPLRSPPTARSPCASTPR